MAIWWLCARYLKGTHYRGPAEGWNGHKMQSISGVLSTLHCEGYIADLRYRWLITSGSARWLIEILSAISDTLKSTRHGGQSTERCIAFGGTTRSPAFTM